MSNVCQIMRVKREDLYKRVEKTGLFFKNRQVAQDYVVNYCSNTTNCYYFFHETEGKGGYESIEEYFGENPQAKIDCIMEKIEGLSIRINYHHSINNLKSINKPTVMETLVRFVDVKHMEIFPDGENYYFSLASGQKIKLNKEEYRIFKIRYAEKEQEYISLMKKLHEAKKDLSEESEDDELE